MTKTVLLQIEGKELVVTFASKETIPDINCLKDMVLKMSKSSDTVRSLLQEREILYIEGENEIFPGRWTLLTEASIVSNQSVLRCTLSNPTAEAPSWKSSSPLLCDSVDNESSIVNVNATHDICMDNEMALCKVEMSSESEGNHDASSASSEDGTSYLQTWQKIPSTFQIPNCFGVEIDNKLTECAPLTHLEISSVVRQVADSIRPIYFPLPQSLMDIALEMVTKYPSLAVKRTDMTFSAGFIKRKLSRRMEYLRRKVEVCGTRKRRSANASKTVLSPSSTRGTVEIDDPVSYERNVERMLYLYRTNVSGEEVKVLLKLTHKGRRAAIINGPPRTIEGISAICPYLNQEIFLLLEMDNVLGEGTAAAFKINWTKLVPQIVTVARKQASKLVRNVLLLPQYANIDNDFDAASRAVLQLLPLLLLCNRRFTKCGRLLFDAHAEDGNLSLIIKEKPMRTTPYIVSIGTSLTIVADGVPYVTPSTTQDAIACVMAMYYVYNMAYPKAIEPTLLFLQGRCLGLEDDTYRNLNIIQLLVRQIEHFSEIA